MLQRIFGAVYEKSDRKSRRNNELYELYYDTDTVRRIVNSSS